jgi:hypothetical protein
MYFEKSCVTDIAAVSCLRDEAQRIAAIFAKLPELLKRS